jgi:hypothetical protein
VAELKEVAPFAPALIQSMRAIGYSLESAVADLIDNSISAEAQNIRIRFSPYTDHPYIAILDDGSGMSPEELVAGMRHGSRSPTEERAPRDLGRFGLGLKTASLAHCRRLTVLTVHEGTVSAAAWDLDIIEQTQRWTLLLLNEEEIAALPHREDLIGHGTAVYWHKLDRLGLEEGSIEAGIQEGMIRVRERIALIFHRFLRPTSQTHAGITISLNEDPLDGRDPFLLNHPATEKLPAEFIRIRDASVHVQPYVLPHFSKLSQAQLDLAGGEEGLRRRQGFYVYRSRRLIIWGSWFRLTRNEELTKLARVAVDVPNSLDDLWTLDVKKSIAAPPAEVAIHLRRIINRIAQRSRRVYTYRGRRANRDNFVHLWDRLQDRDAIAYRINRSHPLVAAVASALPGSDYPVFEALLKNLERLYPLDALYADMASEPRKLMVADATEEDLFDLAGRLRDAIPEPGGRLRLYEHLSGLEPFVYYPDVTQAIIARLKDG